MTFSIPKSLIFQEMDVFEYIKELSERGGNLAIVNLLIPLLYTN